MPLQGAGLKAERLAEMMGAMERRRGLSQPHIAIRQLVRIPAENKQNREGRPAPQLHLFSLEEPPTRLLVLHLPVQPWV